MPRHSWTITNYFFFTGAAPTQIYTLSLHDALPICNPPFHRERTLLRRPLQPLLAHEHSVPPAQGLLSHIARRSEEHTSELQSQFHLVCRLLLEKKKDDTLERSRVCSGPLPDALRRA